MADLDTLVEQPFSARELNATRTGDQPAEQDRSLTVICDLYARVAPLLERVDRRDNDLAIALLSQHLAAFEHVWYPEIEARLGTAATSRHRQRAGGLWRRMRLLQRCLTGDALTGNLDCGALLRRLRGDVATLSRLERQQLRRLENLLGPDERGELLDAWQRAHADAPTRPHPHLPHHGRAEPVAFRLAAWADRLLDTLDARPVPQHRRAGRPRQPDLWTAYVLGHVPAQRDPAKTSKAG